MIMESSGIIQSEKNILELFVIYKNEKICKNDNNWEKLHAPTLLKQ